LISKDKKGGLGLKMKLYISIDMEGISGIATVKQTEPGSKEYEKGRLLMIKELNNYINAAFKYGASEILVNDAHYYMDNILRSKLDQRVDLISGDNKKLSMMEGICEEFDTAFFIGYHAGAGGERAVIDHTYTTNIYQVKINGLKVNEAILNAYLASYYGVPVSLISGDQIFIKETKEVLKDAAGVIVKEARGRTSARLYGEKKVQGKIDNGVKKALCSLDKINLISKEEYITEIEFNNSAMADVTEGIPGVKRNDGRKIIYQCSDMLETYKVFLLAVNLSYTI